MKLTRVKAAGTTFEIVYLTDSHVQALERFRKEFPVFNEYILTAETLETENKKQNEFILHCIRCGSFR